MVSQRKVTEQQGRELADRLKVPYIETSAKDPPVNVDAAFHELVRIVKSFPSDEDNDIVSPFHTFVFILQKICLVSFVLHRSTIFQTYSTFFNTQRLFLN